MRKRENSCHFDSTVIIEETFPNEVEVTSDLNELVCIMNENWGNFECSNALDFLNFMCEDRFHLWDQ